MQINNKFELGEVVYLKTDPDQYPRIVVGLKVTVDLTILYQLVCSERTTDHYEIEISKEKIFDFNKDY